MNKYAYLVQHGVPSFCGWLRFILEHPGFAPRLLGRRADYFLRRKFDSPVSTPEGFVLETPDSLVTFWSLFVERELHSSLWVNPLSKATSPLVLDVGANVGLFSHLVQTINPNAEIIAFEPLPALYQKLKTLPARTGVKLEPRNFAVGRSAGEAIMESPHGYDGVSRISENQKADGHGFKVKVTTLDDEIVDRDVFLIKMDVEDYETEVIAGASKVLKRTRYVISEARSPEFRDSITAALGSDWTRHQLTDADYLFCRKSVS